MSDTYIVLRKPQGAAGAIMEAAAAVGHGEISAEAEQRIVTAARLQTGGIDPKAIDAMEVLARQFGGVASTMRRTLAAESMPKVNLADYPLTRKELQAIPVPRGPFAFEDEEANVASSLSDALRESQPLSGSHGATFLGGKKCDDGSYAAIIVVHHFMSAPTPEDSRYLVTTDGKGNGSCTAVSVA